MAMQIEKFHDGDPIVCDKLNKIVDVCNALLNAKGDANISFQVIPGSGVLINFNNQQVFTTDTKPQLFKVAYLPNASSGTVAPYVMANTYSNTSTGTMNISVGVIQAHSVGDVFSALPVAGIYNGSGYLLDASNKSIGMMELGSYGTVFKTALNFNASGSSGGNYAYDIKDPAGSKVLLGNQTALVQPLSNFNHSQASSGLCTISNTGNWVLVVAGEVLNGTGC